MDYYSEEIFSLPADEVVARASADGMTWVLLSYLQQWCSNNSFPPKGVCLLIEVYRTLGCEVNCWFLSHKYLCGRQSGLTVKTGRSSVPGLKLAVPIEQVDPRFGVSSADSLWDERNLIVKSLRQNSQSLTAWLHLVEKNAELEELLESVWTLFIIKMNTPASAEIITALNEKLDLIRIHGTSGGFWSFVAKKNLLLQVGQILACDKTEREIADSIQNLFACSFSISLDRDGLLQPLTWPN